MKISTFYQIYFKHRFIKANIFLKIYLSLIILIRFSLNSIFSKNKINLDKLIISNPDLLDKDFDYLFEYFNSDKGNFFFNQYAKSIKKEKIHGHEYSLFYDKYFKKLKKDKLNILELGTFKGGATAAFSFFLVILKSIQVTCTQIYLTFIPKKLATLRLIQVQRIQLIM